MPPTKGFGGCSAALDYMYAKRMQQPADRPPRPYALQAGEGWTYRFPPLAADGIDFTVKVGELGQGRRLAIFEYETRSGEEPGDHTHPTEDEVFHVLQGDVTFRCGDETFDTREGGFVFLPRGVEHGYRIRGDRPARLLVVTAPAPDGATSSWGGFVGDFEQTSELRASPPA